MWTDLLSMGAEMRLPRDRLRRQYEEFSGASTNSYTNDNSYNSYPAQQLAPAYGYGYAKLKCAFSHSITNLFNKSKNVIGCCAMKNIDYGGEHRNLPISYKCPVGSRGPPGDTGFSRSLKRFNNLNF